jgi:phage terminase large subunit-like protein
VLGDIEAGEPILAGRLVRLACERHLKDRVLAAALGGHPDGWWFDPDAADIVIQFFETVLRLPDVRDEYGDPVPFLLQPSQDFKTGAIFGWKGRDGLRRYREVYDEEGKGGGKTPWLAGIGLFGLTEDEEFSAQIYACATSRDQAKVLFTDAERMVDASPDLAGRLLKTVNNIADPETSSFFRPFSRDQGQQSGPRPHMGLLDEVHEYPSSEIALKIRAGAKRRKQPLFIEITNSGFDRTSYCWHRHEHARLVLEGQTKDDRLFAFVCNLDEGDDPLKDSSCWLKTNPLLGVAITREYLERQVENAKNIPSETNTVLRLNFCVWTAQNVRLIPTAEWAACSEKIADAELRGKPCYGGLDLGQSDDFSAWARLWDLLDGRVAVRLRFWIPEAALKKYPHRMYDVWRRAGVLEITEGNTTDYAVVQKAVLDDCRLWGVRQVGFDKRFADQMAQNLQGDGITMVDTPQGFYFTAAIRKLLELVTDAKLCHGADPVLSWMAGNAEGRQGRDGQLRLDKEESGDKIDGISAVVTAIDRWVGQPAKKQSIYATRGLISM